TVQPDEGFRSIPRQGPTVAEAAAERYVNRPGDQTGRERFAGEPGEARGPPEGLTAAEEAELFRPAPGRHSEEERQRDANTVIARDNRGLREKVRDNYNEMKTDASDTFKQATLDDLAGLAAFERKNNPTDPGKLLPAAQSPTQAARQTRNLAGAVQQA